MKYIYFVSYKYENGFGNSVTTTNEKITTIKSIRELEKTLHSKAIKGKLLLDNFFIIEEIPDKSDLRKKKSLRSIRKSNEI